MDPPGAGRARLLVRVAGGHGVLADLRDCVNAGPRDRGQGRGRPGLLTRAAGLRRRRARREVSGWSHPRAPAGRGRLAVLRDGIGAKLRAVRGMQAPQARVGLQPRDLGARGKAGPGRKSDAARRPAREGDEDHGRGDASQPSRHPRPPALPGLRHLAGQGGEDLRPVPGVGPSSLREPLLGVRAGRLHVHHGRRVFHVLRLLLVDPLGQGHQEAARGVSGTGWLNLRRGRAEPGFAECD
mmetsp:Transcript_61396/g.180089  ORF Transcript_61396/g.180089 Transcript_61396/m.180089 type:complete len:240 (+) Transcript_61396:796-1515(+)